MRMGTILTQQKRLAEGTQNLNRSMEVAREGLREFGRNTPCGRTKIGRESGGAGSNRDEQTLRVSKCFTSQR